MRLSFYAWVLRIDVWFQSLKTQTVEFSADRKVSIENSKRSILTRILLVLSSELALMSTFVYFNRILWFNLTLQETKYCRNTCEFSSHLKTQLHAENTLWKRLSHSDLHYNVKWSKNVELQCQVVKVDFEKKTDNHVLKNRRKNGVCRLKSEIFLLILNNDLKGNQ